MPSRGQEQIAVGRESYLAMIAVVLMAAEIAHVLGLPLPSYLTRSMIAAVGAATVLSFGHLPRILARESPQARASCPRRQGSGSALPMILKPLGPLTPCETE